MGLIDKKAHIYLSKLELVFLKNTDAKDYKKSIMLGNLIPDLKPSFISVKHNVENTAEKVELLMNNLCEKFTELTRRFVFRIGELLHYLCDYFTYPHNPELWNGSIISHIRYELKQHSELNRYILHEKYKEDVKNFEFNQDIKNVDELFDEIMRIHEEYLKVTPCIQNDCRYIVSISYNVFRWFLRKLFNVDIKDVVFAL